jgi:hypothetical protein
MPCALWLHLFLPSRLATKPPRPFEFHSRAPGVATGTRRSSAMGRQVPPLTLAVQGALSTLPVSILRRRRVRATLQTQSLPSLVRGSQSKPFPVAHGEITPRCREHAIEPLDCSARLKRQMTAAWILASASSRDEDPTDVAGAPAGSKSAPTDRRCPGQGRSLRGPCCPTSIKG